MPIHGPSEIADDKIFKTSMSGEGSSNFGTYIHSYVDSVSPTESTMYAWYKLKCPNGYSGAGTGRFWEITIYVCGKHASAGAVRKYWVTESNNNNVDSSGLNYTKVDLVFTRNTGGSNIYGTSLDAGFYYKTGLSGWNNGEIHMSVESAAREPTVTCMFTSLGCISQGTSYGAGQNSDVEFLGASNSSGTYDPGSHTAITVADVGSDLTN